jgi:hypothetical protein
MLKRLFWMPLTAVLLLPLSGCDKDKNEDTPQPDATIIDKKITFNIYSETDYTDAPWEDSKMKLTLNLKRISINPHKETVVLDTTLGWIAFRDLPKITSKAQLVKRLSSVNKKEEGVVISITKLVSINGYHTTFAHTLTIDKDKADEVVEVRL